MVRSVRGISPQIPESCFLAENATVIGDVILGEDVSVWYHAVLRGDVMPLRVGAKSNIQDGAVLHGTYGLFGVEMGQGVTVGHSAILHGCIVRDHCLIGMRSVVMDGCEIGEECVVGAGSVVSPGKKFPPRHLILGSPARVVRPLTENEIKFLYESRDNYLLYKTWYA
jgi:carbonic anhydrase/acetyltransferase-like protein (isoleucine patch superfamily)